MLRFSESKSALLDLAQAERIADILCGHRKNSCWSAIISSSLDADRLDYVRRDRLMCGTGTGAIDFTWLLEHSKIRAAPDSADRTFVINHRALQQAETFLLARYQLYDQVYFHKVCRGMECLLEACIVSLKKHIDDGDLIGLSPENSVIRHLQEPTLGSYLRLDDTVVTGTLMQIADTEAEQSHPARLAARIVNREKLDSLDVERWAFLNGVDYGRAIKTVEDCIKHTAALDIETTVFFDEPVLSIYGKGGRESMSKHKKLWIDLERGDHKEIVDVSETLTKLPSERRLGRYFFLHADSKKTVLDYLNSEKTKLQNEETVSTMDL